MDMVTLILTDILLSIVAIAIEIKYMEKRFGKKPEKKTAVFDLLLALAVNTFSVFLFESYGYDPIRIVTCMIMTSSLIIIARCDKEEQIIPNVILLFLVSVRIADILLVTVSNNECLKTELLSSLGGVLSSAIVLIIAKLIQKGAIGMGDIKLFVTIGFYLGSSYILPVMLVSLVAAMIRGLIGMATKKMKKDDTFSLGPYIAAGTMCVMLLGM